MTERQSELAIDIANQKALIKCLGMQNTFTDPEAYLEQAKRYNDAILKLGEFQKEYENAANPAS